MKFDLRVKNLHKSYDNTAVLKGASLSVESGSIYGLLGANGAGKTTIFKILCGLISANEGEILLFDKPLSVQERLQELGILIETPVFYEALSAKENLHLHLQYMGKEGDIEKSLALVGLGNVDKKPVRNFSLGMRQRLGIARTLVHNPKILLLDEPINGLDPLGIIEMRELFLKLSKEMGKTLLISSHILSEIEHVADKIGVLVNGHIAAEESMQNLRAKHSESLEDYFLQILRGGHQHA